MPSDQMNDDHDPLAKALRAEAARVVAPAPADLAGRAKAAVRAEMLAPKRIRFVPWLVIAAAAAGFRVGVVAFALPDRETPSPIAPIVIVPPSAPASETPTPTPTVDLAHVIA